VAEQERSAELKSGIERSTLEFGHYPDKMRRLAQQHCTREAVIDEWLRSGLLVDLLPVVTGSIVLGEPSYSIKKVEHLYMERREAEVTNAGDSVVAYLNW